MSVSPTINTIPSHDPSHVFVSLSLQIRCIFLLCRQAMTLRLKPTPHDTEHWVHFETKVVFFRRSKKKYNTQGSVN